jgi:hypothetical protein
MKIKNMLIGIGIIILCLSSFSFAQEENKIIEEIKNWDYNIGDFAYSFTEKEIYYGVGVQRDLAITFNGLDPDWFYWETGYLAVKLTDYGKGDNDAVYGGLAVNLGRGVCYLIEWAGQKLDAHFDIPNWIETSILRTSIDGTKELDNLWDYKDGWGVCGKISFIKIGLPLGK